MDAGDDDLIAYYRLDESAGDDRQGLVATATTRLSGPAVIGLAAPQRVQAFRPPPCVAGVGDATGDGLDDFAVIDDDRAGSTLSPRSTRFSWFPVSLPRMARARLRSSSFRA